MRWFRRLAVSAALLYSGAALFIFLAQDALIFHPGERQLAQCNLPEGVEHWAHGGERGLLTSAGHSKLLVFFHGNADDACNWRFLGVNHLHKLGFDVLVVEYAGYGGDTRTPSKASIDVAVHAAADWQETRGYEHVVAMGYSLGTGAASLFTVAANADQTVLFAPYDSIYNVAWASGMIFPRMLLKSDFDNLVALQSTDATIHIIHGERDRVIPAQFSAALRDGLLAAGRTVSRRELAGVNHHGLFDSPRFDVIMAEILGG